MVFSSVAGGLKLLPTTILTLVVSGLVVTACGNGATPTLLPTVPQATGTAVPQQPVAEGDTAPDFTSAEAGGGQVTLSQVLQSSDMVVLVFYRGFF